jgi:PAS domain S-box-containing protein
VDRSDLKQWEERLQQIFLSVAEARPEYFQLRLIGTRNEGRELVRIERDENGVRVVPAEQLQAKGHRYYYKETSRLEPGSVYLSWIDLNVEHGELSKPYQPTLRAATPVRDPAGKLFGVVVVNMDMAYVLARVAAFHYPPESVYVANERGNFLLHPRPGRAFAFQLGKPYRLSDAFPDYRKHLAHAGPDAGASIEVPGPQGDIVAYFTERAWDPREPQRRLTFILTEPGKHVFALGRVWPSELVLSMVALLSVAVVLMVVAIRRTTHSLRKLAAASHAIGMGDYRVALPESYSSEVVDLVQAFRRMVTEIETREVELEALNRELARRVEVRTAELSRAHSLQEIILDSIADGVIVADREGRFLLWNAKAEQIVGSGPDEVPPERWSSHFGAYRDEDGTLVPTGELPLLRAMQGQSSQSIELYLCNPGREEGRWAQVTARPMCGRDGEVTGGVAVLVDVTEQKRLRTRLESERTELARVARRALSTGIASSAAHRLSQPIAAMSNYAIAALRLQKQSRLGEAELLGILSRIEALAIEAGKGLDELRSLVRRRKRPPTPVDVNTAADSCLDFLRDRIECLGVEPERHYARELPRPEGDQNELRYVLFELISNALEVLEGVEPARRRLSVSTSYAQEAGIVRIEVADSGAGVPPELARHLFEPVPTTKPDALGVGLYIAKSIIESFRGRIHMRTGELGGAGFCVELPIGKDTAA